MIPCDEAKGFRCLCDLGGGDGTPHGTERGIPSCNLRIKSCGYLVKSPFVRFHGEDRVIGIGVEGESLGFTFIIGPGFPSEAVARSGNTRLDEVHQIGPHGGLEGLSAGLIFRDKRIAE